MATGLELYITVWSGILLLFVVITLGLFYKGGKDRRSLEKEMIEENTRKEKEMIQNKK